MIERVITITKEISRETIVVPAELKGNVPQGNGRITAFVAGATAAANGLGAETCPYAKGNGSGSFRRAWIRGHEHWHARRSN